MRELMLDRYGDALPNWTVTTDQSPPELGTAT